MWERQERILKTCNDKFVWNTDKMVFITNNGSSIMEFVVEE